MSGLRGRGWKRWLGAAALALAPAWLAAAAETAAPDAGGISGAKRDYDALKAPAENTTERPKIDLPPAPTLELRAETTMPGPPRRGRKLTEEERLRELEREKEKSRNWLIEAMAQQDQPASAAATPSVAPAEGNAAELDRAAKLMALLDAISATKSAGKPTGGDTAATDDLQGPPTVINPLDRFMASWMTAGDFELLAPRFEPGPAPGGSGLIRPPLEDAGQARAQLFADVAAGTGRGAVAAENPYLRDVPALAPLSADLAELATPPPAIQPGPITPLIAPTVPPEPPAGPSFSEQLKAQDDAKYFKQLKRF